ncbi:hypothetical protein LOTGIDRAFT_166848 [Lottia gigantea]|uniref:Uncharacterized protein n=1 Tax=Lottia gigantea TaxID=225164 RepID=V4BDM9_LOTGI|nr:hypothetical protein LOTGIDRAFT_166848 [Lottia gigantea]ESO86844.1 hypothetical protein LOTGIDRAFT_166848 [Lottia gigantea]
MAATKARSRFKNAVYRVVRSEYQLERRLELINAFINHNLREELYLASGVGEKDKPMWKVIETNMLLQEHAVNLEENRLLWKQWNRGNQTEGKPCSKNPVPHVCICDQNIVPKSKRKKKKGRGTGLPAWYKRDKETTDEDRYCCCCCKSRDRTATPVPIVEVKHDDTSSDHSESLVSSATSSNTNSFVNSKSTTVSKPGSVGSKAGSTVSKSGNVGLKTEKVVKNWLKNNGSNLKTRNAVSKTGSERSVASANKSLGITNDRNSRQSSDVSAKQSTIVGLNNNGKIAPKSPSLKPPGTISVKSVEDDQINQSKSMVAEDKQTNKPRNLLLDVPEYHTSTISMSGPHTATTNESVSGDTSAEVTTVDVAVNTILSYPEPKPPVDDIFSRIKKKPVESQSPKSMVRKNDSLKPGNTLKIYKMANRDIQKKLAQQKAAREETEKAVLGLTSQNDLGDTEKEESPKENNIESETKTDDEVESDVENASITDRETESDVNFDVPKGTEKKSSTCRIM